MGMWSSALEGLGALRWPERRALSRRGVLRPWQVQLDPVDLPLAALHCPLWGSRDDIVVSPVLNS